MAVAQEHSFSRAALRLHRLRSQAVSQTIGKLEELVGEKVFERSSRDGTLTAGGKGAAVDMREELLICASRARDAITELRSLHEGKLTVAAQRIHVLVSAAGVAPVPPDAPFDQIQVQRSLAGDIPRQILMHQVEFGVLSFKPEDDQLNSTIFYRDDLVFVVYPGHSLATADKVRIHDLGAESFVAHNVDSPMRIKVIEAFKKTVRRCIWMWSAANAVQHQGFFAHGQWSRSGAEDVGGRANCSAPASWWRSRWTKLRLEAHAAPGASQGRYAVARGRGIYHRCRSMAARPEASPRCSKKKKARRRSARQRPRAEQWRNTTFANCGRMWGARHK